MIDYKPLYTFLFNGITDIIEVMEKADNSEENAKFIQYLKILQIGAEELYLRQEDEE